MKAKKLLGSVALTAALAMGTMPAFASVTSTTDSSWKDLDGNVQIGGTGVSNNMNVFSVTGTSNDPNVDPDNLKTGTGSTAIKATVFDADLNVTVPMVVAVAFSTQGGDLTCPSASAYRIYNNGTIKDVKLTHITASSTDFTLANAAQITAMDSSPTAGQKAVQLGLEVGGYSYDLFTLTSTNSGELPSTQMPTISKAANDTTPSSLTLGLSGKTNKFATPLTSAGYLADTLATITYTVECA